MIYSKVKTLKFSLVLTTLLFCTWFALTVNSVYCMPRNKKRTKGQQHMTSSVYNTSNPAVTPLTPASNYAALAKQLWLSLRDIEPVVNNQSVLPLKIPLDGYSLKIKWGTLVQSHAEPTSKMSQVACLIMTHPENYCPPIALEDLENVMQPSQHPESTDIPSSSTDMVSDLTRDDFESVENDLCKDFSETQISADSSERKSIVKEDYNVVREEGKVSIIGTHEKDYVIKGLTDQHSQIPINLYNQIIDLLSCTSIKLIDVENEQDKKDFMSQNRGVTWNHPQNAYTKYTSLGNPTTKLMRRFEANLKKQFKDQMEGDSIKLSSGSYLEVRINSQADVVNSGVFIQLESIAPGKKFFLRKLKNVFRETFALPKDLYILI